MPIKKRTKLPDPSQQELFEEAPAKLVIEAKPKVPVPEGGFVRGLKLDSSEARRRLGPLALSCNNNPTDRAFSIEDRVALLRTPYDDKNPQEARYRNRARGRGTAITAFCITCVGGRKAVTECADTACPLWAFRFGSDPFRGRR